ncbi:MAG: hypothetical protein FJ151_00830 [Euryarchaeota archaeon]|nr:hypothetical protein [Euryarchaeota archaeon]
MDQLREERRFVLIAVCGGMLLWSFVFTLWMMSICGGFANPLGLLNYALLFVAILASWAGVAMARSFGMRAESEREARGLMIVSVVAALVVTAGTFLLFALSVQGLT